MSAWNSALTVGDLLIFVAAFIAAVRIRVFIAGQRAKGRLGSKTIRVTFSGKPEDVEKSMRAYLDAGVR